MPLNPEILRDLLADTNPEALLLGTETEFDPALLGIAERDGNTVAVYSQEGVIACLVRDGMAPEGAEEWCAYNIEGARFGGECPDHRHDRVLIRAKNEPLALVRNSKSIILVPFDAGGTGRDGRCRR